MYVGQEPFVVELVELSGGAELVVDVGDEEQHIPRVEPFDEECIVVL